MKRTKERLLITFLISALLFLIILFFYSEVLAQPLEQSESFLLAGEVYKDSIAPVSVDYALARAAELFPMLVLPELKVWIFLFLVYTLLAGPLLYYLFKRWDKREWLWLILPLSALLVAGGIYAYGMKERGGTVLAHTVSFIEYVDTHPRIEAVTAFLVPRQGDYIFEVPQPYRTYPVNMWPIQRQQDMERFTTDRSTQLFFDEIEHWGMRKAVVHDQSEEQKLLLEVIESAGDRVRVRVTNQTRLQLNQVALFSGERVSWVGDVAPDEVLEVEVTIGFNEPWWPINQLLPDNQYPDRQWQMLSGMQQRIQGRMGISESWRYVEEAFDQLPARPPDMLADPAPHMNVDRHKQMIQLIGWSNDPVIPYSFQDNEVTREDLTLVYTFVELRGEAE
jgi:hypothetical protein